MGLFIALGDVFKKTPPSVGVDLLFVDGEDWGAFDSDSAGNYPDALFGSQYFASHLPSPNYKPLFGVLWGWLFLGETLPAAALAGGILILGGTLLVTRS